MDENLEMKESRSGRQNEPNSYAERNPLPADDDHQVEANREMSTVSYNDPTSNQIANAAHQPEHIESPATLEKSGANELRGTPNDIGPTDQQWFDRKETEELITRWTSVQVQFVDQPCSAVEQAETTVAEVIERVKQMISDRQQSLNERWINHDDITTEELRIIVQNYRSLLNHLLKL